VQSKLLKKYNQEMFNISTYFGLKQISEYLLATILKKLARISGLRPSPAGTPVWSPQGWVHGASQTRNPGELFQ